MQLLQTYIYTYKLILLKIGMNPCKADLSIFVHGIIKKYNAIEIYIDSVTVEQCE